MSNKRAKLIAGNENPGHIKYLKTKIIIGLVAAIFFIYLAWYSYSTQVANLNETDLPVIKAPSSPIKVKPDDPGGLKIEHKDKEIYDHISGKKPRGTERLVTHKYKPATYEEVKKSVNKQTKSKSKQVRESEIKPVIIQLPPNKKAASNKRVKVKKYNLRVAALTSPKVKDKAWNILINKYPNLRGFKPKVTTTNKNGKTVYFLEVGNIATKNKADKICRSIIAAGGKCKIYQE